LNLPPTCWDNEFFHILFAYEWEVFENEAGHLQWRPSDDGGDDMVPMAQGSQRREPRILTTDLSLRFDSIYVKISRRFKDDQKAFEDAFALAWIKLTHRDMGPAVRESGLTVSPLVSTTWAAASSHRVSDKRGVNGGRLRLEPQRSWEANEPAKLAEVLPVPERIAEAAGGSFADVLAIAGAVGVETAAKAAGHDITVSMGRGDATGEQTDVNSFSFLEPTHERFRDYLTEGLPLRAEYLLLDRASLLGMTPPELTVLIGGLRVLGVNFEGSELRALAEVYGSDDADEKFVADFVKVWTKLVEADRYGLHR